MTETNKNNGSVAKGVLVGAAVLAGVATAIALKDEKNRKKVGKTLTDMREKGMELKRKTEKMAKDQLRQNGMAEKILKKSPVKKA